jgi:hypothetical protein
MLMMCLLTAQTVECTTGGGLPFKIMYLFTGIDIPGDEG